MKRLACYALARSTSPQPPCEMGVFSVCTVFFLLPDRQHVFEALYVSRDSDVDTGRQS